MKCGDCGFWEPRYIKLLRYTNIGQCTAGENLLTHPVLKCIIGNWAPRPTIAEVLESLEAKEVERE